MSPEELEKARAAINSLLAEGWDNDAATVRELVAEIERLRSALNELEKIVTHKQESSEHWYQECMRRNIDLHMSKRTIKHLTTQIEELKTQNNDLMEHCNNLRNRAQKAEFKVVKRERTMQEERARLIARCDYDCPEGGCLVSEETISTTVKAFGKVLQTKAHKQLWDEHKIGLNASITHQECQECSDEFCDEDECPKETRQ